jgi:hypothetical protein
VREQAAPDVVAANRSALKEWASVEAALVGGGTILMLRKGGIYEQKQGFQVEHRQFWIFPTLFHQSPDELAPAFEWALESAASRHPAGPRLRIGSYAMVTDALRVERMEALERLAGLHPLANPTVHARFHYRKRPYLHVLVVRHYRLPEPRMIRNTAEYEGCISWVELETALPTGQLRPVLAEAQFEQRREDVLRRLGTDGVERV